jgi:hypothetical protein
MKWEMATRKGPLLMRRDSVQKGMYDRVTKSAVPREWVVLSLVVLLPHPNPLLKERAFPSKRW